MNSYLTYKSINMYNNFTLFNFIKYLQKPNYLSNDNTILLLLLSY